MPTDPGFLLELDENGDLMPTDIPVRDSNLLIRSDEIWQPEI